MTGLKNIYYIGIHSSWIRETCIRTIQYNNVVNSNTQRMSVYIVVKGETRNSRLVWQYVGFSGQGDSCIRWSKFGKELGVLL